MPASHQIDYWTPLECRSAISMKVSDTVLRWGNEVNQLNEVLKFELFCMKHYAGSSCTFPRTLSLSMLLVTQIYSASTCDVSHGSVLGPPLFILYTFPTQQSHFFILWCSSLLCWRHTTFHIFLQWNLAMLLRYYNRSSMAIRMPW